MNEFTFGNKKAGCIRLIKSIFLKFSVSIGPSYLFLISLSEVSEHGFVLEI